MKTSKPTELWIADLPLNTELNEKMGTRVADGYMTRSTVHRFIILNNANDFINTYAQRLEDDY